MADTTTGAATARREARPGHQPTIILGTIGHDCHVAGISILRYAFERAGFRVVFLGALVDQQEFINAAKETAADAILVSSLYGMGRIDCEGFRDRCREAGLDDVIVYIGGILVTDPEEWAVTERIFKELGFDRVYPPGTKPETAIADLRCDLGLDGEG